MPVFGVKNGLYLILFLIFFLAVTPLGVILCTVRSVLNLDIAVNFVPVTRHTYPNDE